MSLIVHLSFILNILYFIDILQKKKSRVGGVGWLLLQLGNCTKTFYERPNAAVGNAILWLIVPPAIYPRGKEQYQREAHRKSLYVSKSSSFISFLVLLLPLLLLQLLPFRLKLVSSEANFVSYLSDLTQQRYAIGVVVVMVTKQFIVKF